MLVNVGRILSICFYHDAILKMQVKKLDLSDNEVGCKGYLAIIEYFNNAEELILINCDISGEGLKEKGEKTIKNEKVNS